MTDSAISGYAAAGALTGAELIEIVQGSGPGSNKKVTLNTLATFVGGGGGGVSTGLGYPTGLTPANPGALYAATDGVPGSLLYAYAGTFTGQPYIVNHGAASSTTTGALAVTMLRATTAGNILVAFAGDNSSSGQVTIGSGWTSIINNNGPTPALNAAWRIADGTSTDLNPYTVSSQSSGNSIVVVEVKGQAASSPIAQSISTSNGGVLNAAGETGDLILIASVSSYVEQNGGTLPPGSQWGGMAQGSQPTNGCTVIVFGLAFQTSFVPGTEFLYGVQGNGGGMAVVIAAGTASNQYWYNIG